MALADELDKTASERYALVKITPALELNDSLSVKSGTIYEAVLTNRFEISSVEVDGVAYTESTTADPTSTKYYYDIDSGQFEINFGVAIGTKEAVLFFILRFTDAETGVFDEDGIKNPTTDAKQWECRLKGAPTFDVSVKDFMAGVTSISASRFNIVNTDDFMSSFLGSDYSFFNKDCEVSLIINAVVFAKFTGKLRDVNPAGENYSFQLYDNLYNLNEKCLMGDTSDDAYYNISNYPDMDRAKEGNVIPYVLGRSPFAFKLNDNNYYDFDVSKTPEAVCTDITTNRTWGLCRSGPNGFKTADYGDANDGSIVVSGGTTVYGTGTRNTFSFNVSDSPQVANIELLDTIEIVESATTWRGIVTSITAFSAPSVDYGGFMESGATVATYDNVAPNPNQGVGLMITQGIYTFYPMVVNDYIVQTTTLDSGNKFYEILFNASFHTNHPGMNALNYETDKVYFRFTESVDPTDEISHGNTCERILDAAGISVNAASITAADSALVADVNMMIPALGERDAKPYTHYLGLLMQSTFGYVYRDNSSLDTKYKLFDAPTSANLILEDEMINTTISFDGKEMGESLRIFNDGTFYYYTNLVYVLGTSAPADRASEKTTSHTISSTKSKYLHDLTNTKSQESILTDTSERATDKQAFLENIQTFIKFSTSSKQGNLNIGDSVALQNDRIPGDKVSYLGYSVTLAVIIGMKYGAEKITFTCIDFKGL